MIQINVFYYCPSNKYFMIFYDIFSIGVEKLRDHILMQQQVYEKLHANFHIYYIYHDVLLDAHFNNFPAHSSAISASSFSDKHERNLIGRIKLL